MPTAVISLLLALWTTPACPAGFCDCMPAGTVAQAREGSAAVFAGTVVSIRDTVAPSGEHQHPMRAVTLQVRRGWRGVDAERVTVVTGFGGGDCGYDFHVGEPYLVYATRYAGLPDQPLVVGICSRTEELAKAGKDVEELGPPERIWLAAPRREPTHVERG